MPKPLRHIFQASGQLVLLGLIIYLVGYLATTSRWTCQLYRTWRFPQSQGHHLAGQLARAQTTNDRLCLLLGPSTVREAFDEEIMRDTRPDIRFLNGGTSGGTIFLYEAMTELLRQSEVKPDCVVLGINSWTLISRDIRLNAAGYTDFLDVTNGQALVEHERNDLRAEAEDQIRLNTLWPYNRVSRHVGRLMRSALYMGQAHLSWHDPLPLPEFSLWHRELGWAPQHMYDDEEPLPDYECNRILNLYQEEGLFDPDRYARPEHLTALRSVLGDLTKISPHVIVLRMPQHSYGREHFEPPARDRMDEVLAEYESRGVVVIDLSAHLPDSAFRDVAHLLGSARPEFSTYVAELVATTIDTKECRE